MVQEEIITKKLSADLAEVAVVRVTACGKSCSSCESCMFQNELKVVAENPMSIEGGKKVLIETKTSKVFGAVVAVYLLPALVMIAAAIVAAVLGATEAICVISAFSALIVSILLTIIFHRFSKGNKIVYTIVKELN